MPNREVEPNEQERARQREEIALIAYSYWQNRGCEDGHDVEDWLMAEEEYLSRPAPRREEQQHRREARTAA